MKWNLLTGLACLVLAICLAVSIRANGVKAEQVAGLKRDLVAASSALEQASKDIKRFAAAEGVSAADAAKICRREGDNAFERGVEIGEAICAARG